MQFRKQIKKLVDSDSVKVKTNAGMSSFGLYYIKDKILSNLNLSSEVIDQNLKELSAIKNSKKLRDQLTKICGDAINRDLEYYITGTSNYWLPSSEEYYMLFTTNLDWAEGKFGDGGSCFWYGRKEAKEMIRENKGFAIQFFQKSEETGKLLPRGRCWAVYLEEYNALMTFNFYSKAMKSSSGGYAELTEVLARYFKRPVRWLDLYNERSRGGTLYINDKGYYFSGDAIKEPEVDLNWRLTVDYFCNNCGKNMGKAADVLDGRGNFWCEPCGKRYLQICNYDYLLYRKNLMLVGPDDKLYYSRNFHRLFFICAYDRKPYNHNEAVEIQGYVVHKNNVEYFTALLKKQQEAQVKEELKFSHRNIIWDMYNE